MTRRERVTVWEPNTRRPNPVPTCAHCGCWRIEHLFRHSADPARRFRCNHAAGLPPSPAVTARVYAELVLGGCPQPVDNSVGSGLNAFRGA